MITRPIDEAMAKGKIVPNKYRWWGSQRCRKFTGLDSLSLIRHPQAKDWTTDYEPLLALSGDQTEFKLIMTNETLLGEIPGSLHNDQDWGQQQQKALQTIDLNSG